MNKGVKIIAQGCYRALTYGQHSNMQSLVSEMPQILFHTQGEVKMR